ncbi:MAG: hypothetical protein MUF62_02020 [Chitinophagaceae bacterium]|nr:hypothetical protein [Chitinophagaceae bacterium]
MQALPKHHSTHVAADLFPAKWFKALVVLAAVGLGWALWPGRFYFLNDDFIHIPMASDGTLGHHNSARHINDFSLFLDHLLFGKWAPGYHLTNALLHVANVFMLGWLFQLVSRTFGITVPRKIIVLMVLGFGLYAFHAETIFWILSRTASLSLLLVLLSWWFMWQAIQRWWLVFPSLACFWLALFTYETSWLLLPYLLLWWYWARQTMEQHLRKRLLMVLWPLVLSWLLYLPLRQHLIQGVLGHYEAGNVLQFNVAALATNAYKLFFRSFLPPISTPAVFVSLSVVIAVCMVALMYSCYRLQVINKLWKWLLICWLASYSLFISLGISVTGYESDRYLYFSSAFLAAWVLYSLYLISRPYRALAMAGTTLFLGYHLLFLQVAASDYQTASTITKSTIEQLQQQPANATVTLVNLPITFKGIPTFRYGFAEAIAWQLDSTRVGSIRVMTAINSRRMPAITVESDKDEGSLIYFSDTGR